VEERNALIFLKMDETDTIEQNARSGTPGARILLKERPQLRPERVK
jgi:hypothetical protein